jgi:glycerophosphoryl diester phosphodiesterase
MIELLAHRANLHGPDHATENHIETTRAALAEGFGVEIDLRRDEQGSFYISHDRASLSPERDFAHFAKLFREFRELTVALNVKELGYERELLAMQLNGDYGNRSFLFDFELLEPSMPGRAQAQIRSLPGGERATLAARGSDRGESLEQCLAIPAEVVWLDEFDAHWITRDVVQTMKTTGRRIYAVSPELHGYCPDIRLRRWADFKAWGIDGLCTDFPLAAREFFTG